MKKLTILILLFILSMLMIPSDTYASDLGFPGSIKMDELSWTRAASGGYYYIQSNRFLIDFSEVDMEFNTQIGDWEQAIVAYAGDFNSRVDIYETDVSLSSLKHFNISYESPEVPEVMFLFGDEVQSYTADTDQYMGKYMQITLMLNPSPPSGLVTNIEFWMNNYHDQYNFIINTYRELLIDQTIEDLPLTAGNPYVSGLTGTVHDWVFDDVTNTFAAKVQYYYEYNISITNIAFADDAFLSNVESIDYYTIQGEKYFQFNFIDNENVLLTGSGQFAKQWNGFALWNLSTNEFIQYNKALALTYIEVTEARQMFAYLYLPGIPMDDVLNVNGHINYRYGYKNIFGTQKYNDWEMAVFSLEKDAESYGSQSIFEGALPQWSYDVLGGSIAAFSIGIILSMVPGLQPIGLTLLLGGLAGIVSVNAAAIHHVKTGLTTEIETITPNTTLRTTLNNHYTLAAGSLTVIPTNAQVHKLFIGTFTKTATNVVEPDANTLVYTEVTWATNGQVYTLDQKIIDSEAILDQDYQSNLPVEGETGWFADLFGGVVPPWVIWTGVIVLILYFAPTVDKGTTSLTNILGNRKKTVLIAVIVIILLIVAGVIRI